MESFHNFYSSWFLVFVFCLLGPGNALKAVTGIVVRPTSSASAAADQRQAQSAKLIHLLVTW
jgi:hypothetical protein